MGFLSAIFGRKKPKLQAKFDVAQTTPDNRNHWAMADNYSSVAELTPEIRRKLRSRSRYEAQNSSFYSGILQTAVNHIIGNGPRLQLTTENVEGNARVEAAWRRWCSRVDFAEICRTAFITYWRDGEVFMLRAQSELAGRAALDVRTFEAEQIATSIMDTWPPKQSDDGIRFDTLTNSLQFHILQNHPGDARTITISDGKWYPAEEVVHLMRIERPGQIRGIPRATPGLQLLPIMRRQELATLFRAETAANFALFLKSTSDDSSYLPDDDQIWTAIPTQRNMLTTLPPNTDVGQVQSSQTDAPQYDQFQRTAMQSFSRCFNMPLALALGTSKDSNFSSFKGDIRDIWEPEVHAEQSRFEHQVIRKIFRWWLEESVFVSGLLDGMPSLDEIDETWHWPPLPDLDAVESAIAMKLRLQSGSTLTEEQARRGNDWSVQRSKAAADFGVDDATYLSLIRAQVFDVASAAQAAQQQPGQPGQQPAATGEYTTLGQRAFSNNQKRIRQTLDQFIGGTISQTMAEQTLLSIGLSADRVGILLQDALDGAVDDTAISGQPV